MLEVLEIIAVSIWLTSLVMWCQYPAKERKCRVFKFSKIAGITCMLGWLTAIAVVEKEASNSYRLERVESNYEYENGFIYTTEKSRCKEYTYMARPNMFVISMFNRDILEPVEENVVKPELCKEIL